MPNSVAMDPDSFRRVLARNVTVPLAVGVASALIFVAVVSYLLAMLAMVEQSERVIGQANPGGQAGGGPGVRTARLFAEQG